MLNRIEIIGYLGADPDARALPSGKAVATFSVATSETYTDTNGNKVEDNEWHRVEFFGRTADIINQYAKKGSLVYLDGKMKTDRFKDKEGVEREIKKIIGKNFKFLSNTSEARKTEADRQSVANMSQNIQVSAPGKVVPVADDAVSDNPNDGFDSLPGHLR